MRDEARRYAHALKGAKLPEGWTLDEIDGHVLHQEPAAIGWIAYLFHEASGAATVVSADVASVRGLDDDQLDARVAGDVARAIKGV